MTFGKSVDELQSDLRGYQSELNACQKNRELMADQYARLWEVKEMLESSKGIFDGSDYSDIYYSIDFTDGMWNGENYEQYKDERLNIHHESVTLLDSDLSRDIWNIDIKMSELFSQIEDLDHTITRLDSKIERCQRRIAKKG